MYADVMMWEIVDVEFPRKTKYVFLFTFHAYKCNVLHYSGPYITTSITFPHVVAMTMTCSSLSWWTCFPSKVASYISSNVTSCVKNASQISSPARFATSQLSDPHYAPPQRFCPNGSYWLLQPHSFAPLSFLIASVICTNLFNLHNYHTFLYVFV